MAHLAGYDTSELDMILQVVLAYFFVPQVLFHVFKVVV